MEFIKPLGNLELVLIFTFILFYVLYLIRLYKFNKNIRVNKRKVFFKVLIRSIYFSLLIISLLGPSYGENKQEINVVGKDIMILVDLSESMNASDIKPTRLEKIKFEMGTNLKVEFIFRFKSLSQVYISIHAIHSYFFSVFEGNDTINLCTI